MERKNNQLTFLDNVTSNLGGKRTAEFFVKCDKFIPWDKLAEPLKDMYANNTSKGGAGEVLAYKKRKFSATGLHKID